MATHVTLRAVIDADLPIFFVQQLDLDANYIAAFTADNPADRAAFDAHWQRIRGDASILVRTVVADGQVAGYIASFERWGSREVSYWLGREFWGRGIATTALRLFLGELTARPLAARAAADNHASIRVLQKCGFTVTGHDRGFAHARGAEIDELILTLAADDPGVA
jgi:RimJ/RimL family protein N-acetyltransferase